ncbi:MAG: hypothetical protein AB1306_06980 [Nitrospirota bacterium]
METLKQIPFDLSTISENVVEVLLLDSFTETSLFKEIIENNIHRPEILTFLLNHPLTPEDARQLAAETLKLPVPAVKKELVPEHTASDEERESFSERKTKRLLQTIQGLKMGEKLQLALRGSHEIRSVLLRDTNPQVMNAVLNNPKITDTEIELLAKQKTTSIDIIREIAKKKEWIKNYQIVFALVSNSKTPVGIALKHIKILRIKDLAKIGIDKNVPDAIRSTAKKLIEARKA